MKIVFLDNTAVPDVKRGPGSPAYFSRYAIDHLRKLGHDVTIHGAYDDAVCVPADVVICEWCNELAYQAAERPLKKLIVRMRGYDAYGPLNQLKWDNVDALVYESPLLKDIVDERFPPLRSFNTHVIPSGVDLANIPFRDDRADCRFRSPKIVALIARTTSDKGYQLAYEWARQRQDVLLHVTGALGQTNPRLTSYLKYAAPPNVVVHGTVDTVPWLEDIKADFLLSASIHESLGYVIAEAMAMGIKPLIHDAPGITQNWPVYLTWQGFADLDRLLGEPYTAHTYREFVEHRLDAAECSATFAELVTRPSTRDNAPAVEALRRNAYDQANVVFQTIRTAIGRPVNMNVVEEIVTDFRARTDMHSLSSVHRYGSAMGTAVAFFNHADLPRAELWACRALLEYARPDAMALLGEIAEARGDTEEAVQWLKASCAVDDTPNRYRYPDLIDGRQARLAELEKSLAVTLAPGVEPAHYLIVVAVRNAEKYIARCLGSILRQSLSNWTCVVVDDVSTDATASIADTFVQADSRFTVVRNTERKWQARNTVEIPRRFSTNPEDVVVAIDGDDWLAADCALEEIRSAYVRGAWMTYGQLIESEGAPTRFGVYPKRIAETGRFAEHVWCATPPRTFKRFLLDQLVDEDFMIEGAWPKFAGDVSVFLPLLQLACERAVGITKPIYCYNVSNVESDHNTDPYEQTRQRDLLLTRPQKKRFERP